MYSLIPGGKMHLIQGLECWTPAPGFVFNVLTRKLERRQIITRSARPSEQYWERQVPPTWYKKKEKEEERQQEAEPDYIDPKLEEYRQQEWDRRLNGCWFMNNGVPTYLTGAHYLYLNWWKIDIGYPGFRQPDLEYFYFQEYVVEDPICLGMIEITKRRFGKTFRGGLFVFNYPSFNEQARAGIQSKTGKDAKKVFSKAVISPFKKLPKFFRPEYDKSQGLTPKSELLFQATNKRGKNSEDALENAELESGIDHEASAETAYDGQKLYRKLDDEVGKTIEADVAERWEVTRYCLLDDQGRVIGKALETTTVEEMEKGGGTFKRLVDNSNHYEVRNEDGTSRPRKKDEPTVSGLYLFFMSAKKTRHFDKYGFPDEERTEREILEERKRVSHDSRVLSARIRKEPLTIQEAFRIDGDHCHFNAMKLNDQRDFLSWQGKDLVERGNLVWKDGIRDSKVVWEPNQSGRWTILRGFNPRPEELNLTKKVGTKFFPSQAHRFGMACDPYDHDVTQDSRRSNGASLVKQKHNINNPGDPFVGAYVIAYLARPNTSDIFYEDMIKQCFYFSAPMLVENNKQGIIKYFRARNYEPFLTKLRGYKDVGVPSTPENKNMGMDLIESMIEDHCSVIYFIKLIDDLLEFDVKETQKYDLAMAMLWTEVACMNAFKIVQTEKRDITEYFKFKKVRSLR